MSFIVPIYIQRMWSFSILPHYKQTNSNINLYIFVETEFSKIYVLQLVSWSMQRNKVKMKDGMKQHKKNMRERKKVSPIIFKLTSNLYICFCTLQKFMTWHYFCSIRISFSGNSCIWQQHQNGMAATDTLPFQFQSIRKRNIYSMWHLFSIQYQYQGTIVVKFEVEESVVWQRRCKSKFLFCWSVC